MSGNRMSPLALHAAVGFMLLLAPTPALHDILAHHMGEEAVFKTLPVDPWDSFMGRHVILRLDLGTLDCAQLPCAWKPESGDSPSEVHVAMDCASGPCKPLRATELRPDADGGPYLTLKEWTWRQPDAPSEDSGTPLPQPIQLECQQTVYYFFDEDKEDPSADLAGKVLLVRGHLWRGRFTPMSVERVARTDQ